MVDREQVIKGLEIVWDAFNHMEHELYADYVFDALALLKAQNDQIIVLERGLVELKAQEPVAPIFDYDGRDVWLCGNCHRTIFHPTRTDEDENEKNYRRFCFHCGRAVKWNA